MSKSAGVVIGQKSPYANQFVQSVQNPFTATVKGILDPINAARASGSLKYEDITNAQTAFEDAVSALLDTQKSYEGLGKGQAQVIAQSRATLGLDEKGQAIAGGFIANARDTFSQHLAATPKPVDPNAELPPVSATPPSNATILNPEGSTPAIKAMGAAEQARKRALGGGRAGTILTGSLGLASPATGKTPALKLKKSILGGGGFIGEAGY